MSVCLALIFLVSLGEICIPSEPNYVGLVIVQNFQKYIYRSGESVIFTANGSLVSLYLKQEEYSAVGYVVVFVILRMSSLYGIPKPSEERIGRGCRHSGRTFTCLDGFYFLCCRLCFQWKLAELGTPWTPAVYGLCFP